MPAPDYEDQGHQEESGREKAAWHQAAKSLETLAAKVRRMEPSFRALGTFASTLQVAGLLLHPATPDAFSIIALTTETPVMMLLFPRALAQVPTDQESDINAHEEYGLRHFLPYGLTGQKAWASHQMS